MHFVQILKGSRPDIDNSNFKESLLTLLHEIHTNIGREKKLRMN
jgi:hypothetical protein